MRHRLARLTVAVVLVLTSTSVWAQAPTSSATPQTTWYFYTVKWGYQDEFLDLFQRNHYPILKAQLDAGVFTSLRTFVPQNHGDGRADWTFAVELVRAANPPAFNSAAAIAKLYPDRDKFRREEQRRFELLVAHWDVPLNAVDFQTRSLTQ